MKMHILFVFDLVDGYMMNKKNILNYIKKVYKKIKKILKKPDNTKNQTLFIYCSKCKNELCSTNSFISDTYDKYGSNHVKYKCSVCGKEDDYNFDIAPIPVNWDFINRGQRSNR